MHHPPSTTETNGENVNTRSREPPTLELGDEPEPIKKTRGKGGRHGEPVMSTRSQAKPQTMQYEMPEEEGGIRENEHDYADDDFEKDDLVNVAAPRAAKHSKANSKMS